MLHSRPTPVALRRRGAIAPIVTFSLLIVLAALALVLDRLWIEMARSELQTAAESAALAAAQQLASDELLKPQTPPPSDADPLEPPVSVTANRARQAAAAVGAKNGAAGQLVQVLPADVQIGVLAFEESTGQTRFLMTDYNPHTAVVTARRSRQRGNPISLFLAGVTGEPYADVAARSEASVDNRIVGLRPLVGATVPAVPGAILRRDPSGRRKDTWEDQIENRQGADRFSFDHAAGRVVETPDGLPELILKSAPLEADPATSNIVLLELNPRQPEQQIENQIVHGFGLEDLEPYDGELLAAQLPPLAGKGTVVGPPAEALGSIVGQPRVWLLYDVFEPSSGGWGRVVPVALVAGRVMQVRAGTVPDTTEIVIQPTVLTTRTALLASEILTSQGNGTWGEEQAAAVASPQIEPDTQTPRSKYIYKLLITQ